MSRYRGNHYDPNKNNSNQINQIKFYEKLGNYQRALTLLNDFLYVHPYDDRMTAYKAMLLSKMQRDEEAKQILEDLIENGDIKSEENRFYILGRYAKVLTRLGEDEKAIYYFEKVIKESNGLQLFNRYELALLYQKQNRGKDAINILTIDGFNNLYLNVKRAQIYLLQNNYKAALNSLRKDGKNIYKKGRYETIDNRLLQQEKNSIIGHAYFKMKDYEKALPYLYSVQTIKTTYAYFYAYMDIANIYIIYRKFDDAIKICEDLLKISNNNDINNKIKNVLISAYSGKNDYEQAHKYINNSTLDNNESKLKTGLIELYKGNFIEAEKNFEILEENDIYDRVNEFYSLLLVKFRLKKYDEALRIISLLLEKGNPEVIKNIKYRIDRVKLLIYIKQGKPIPDRDLTYSERQIISYNRESAINHVISHHIENIKISKFQSIEQIKKIFDEIGDYLTKDNIIYNSCFDQYIVKYSFVGTNINDDNVNQLRVVTLPETKNIVTMYPLDGSESLMILDEYDEEDKPKIKRLSQIDKFNRKYNMS